MSATSKPRIRDYPIQQGESPNHRPPLLFAREEAHALHQPRDPAAAGRCFSQHAAVVGGQRTLRQRIG